jgi:hypothetical protein
MFPLSYQKTLRAHLNESQYLTLQLLLLLLQVHRQVKQFQILDFGLRKKERRLCRRELVAGGEMMKRLIPLPI